MKFILKFKSSVFNLSVLDIHKQKLHEVYDTSNESKCSNYIIFLKTPLQLIESCLKETELCILSTT